MWLVNTTWTTNRLQMETRTLLTPKFCPLPIDSAFMCRVDIPDCWCDRNLNINLKHMETIEIGENRENVNVCMNQREWSLLFVSPQRSSKLKVVHKISGAEFPWGIIQSLAIGQKERHLYFFISSWHLWLGQLNNFNLFLQLLVQIVYIKNHIVSLQYAQLFMLKCNEYIITFVS